MGLFSQKGHVGIDLGHHTIKAAQVERVGSRWRVSRFASVPTPVDSIKDGVVVDAKAVGQALKQMLKDAHISATQAHIAAAGGAVFVRPVSFPKMNEATLRKSIRFEASRFIPGSVEDSYIEFEILGTGDENNMDVLVVAAPKDVVESRITACEHAGIEVDGVDIESFAAYRSLAEFDLEWPAGESVGLIDIGATTTCVSIVHNGVFAMNRSIPHGGKILTEALMSYFKLPEDQAELGKAQLDLMELLGEGGPKENPPLRVIQPHLDDMVREIRRSLNYFQAQQTEGSQTRQIGSLLLSGGGARIPGLAEYVTQKLGLNATDRGVFDTPWMEPAPDPAYRGHEYSVAAGLAMRACPRAAASKTPSKKAVAKASPETPPAVEEAA